MLYGDWIGRWGRSFPEKEALVDAIGNRLFRLLVQIGQRLLHGGAATGDRKQDGQGQGLEAR
jgi:hypothetical protein